MRSPIQKKTIVGSASSVDFVEIYRSTEDKVYRISVEDLPGGGGEGGSGTVTEGNENTLAYYSADGDTVGSLAAITGSRALVSNSSGLPVASSVTSTELGYLSGVSSAIQTQINSKQPSATALTAIAALTPAANKLAYFISDSDAALTDFTVYGRTLAALADAGAGRTALGLGTAAVQNIGTSGANVPLLNGNNVFSGSNIISATQLHSPGTAANNFVSVAPQASNQAQWLRFRRSGSPSTPAGVVFSTADAAHYFVSADSDGSLSIRLSTESSSTPSFPASVLLKITPAGNVIVGAGASVHEGSPTVSVDGAVSSVRFQVPVYFFRFPDVIGIGTPRYTIDPLDGQVQVIHAAQDFDIRGVVCDFHSELVLYVYNSSEDYVTGNLLDNAAFDESTRWIFEDEESADPAVIPADSTVVYRALVHNGGLLLSFAGRYSGDVTPSF